MSNVYAMPAPDAPKPDVTLAAINLVMSLGDAKGTAATLKRLAEESAEPREAKAAAEQARAELAREKDAHDARIAGEQGKIARLWADHEHKVEASQRQHDEAIAADKQALANGKAAVEQERARLVRLNDDLERRLALVKQASV